MQKGHIKINACGPDIVVSGPTVLDVKHVSKVMICDEFS